MQQRDFYIVYANVAFYMLNNNKMEHVILC